MAGDFAKLFGSGADQIVAIRKWSDNDEPEIRLFFQPPPRHKRFGRDPGNCNLLALNRIGLKAAEPWAIT